MPISYLKQGLSLINLGRKGEAKFFLQTLIDKFPESEEAKKAKEKLKELSRKDQYIKRQAESQIGFDQFE